VAGTSEPGWLKISARNAQAATKVLVVNVQPNLKVVRAKVLP
jgi:hypothetical protein